MVQTAMTLCSKYILRITRSQLRPARFRRLSAACQLQRRPQPSGALAFWNSVSSANHPWAETRNQQLGSRGTGAQLELDMRSGMDLRELVGGKAAIDHRG